MFLIISFMLYLSNFYGESPKMYNYQTPFIYVGKTTQVHFAVRLSEFPII